MEVREAVSGQHGLQMLHANQPDLILLDLELPEEDASHLLVALRAQIDDERMPIIVMGAEPPNGIAGDDGASTTYLQKPFSAPTLLQQVHSALSRASWGEVRGAAPQMRKAIR